MTLDIVALGAGPANLALAVQLLEDPNFSQLDFRILEAKPEFAWHPGMLLPHAHLDTHFAKDLVTMSNPRSQFTYLNFLACHGRLESFLNLGHANPFRKEFNEYLSWTASHFEDRIDYGCTVESIARKSDGRFAVHASDRSGARLCYEARNVVLGIGGRPAIPFPVAPDHPRIIHTARFLPGIADSGLGASDRPSFAVIGSGQSGGEIVSYLIREFPGCRIEVITSGFHFAAKEVSPFINELFNESATGMQFEASTERRRAIRQRYRNTNISVVEAGLLKELYNDLYEEQFFGEGHLEIHPFCRVKSVKGDGAGVSVEIADCETDASLARHFDCAVLATGYEFDQGRSLMPDLASKLVESPGDGFSVGRDYALRFKEGAKPAGGIFLNGNAARSHGLAEDVLSVLAPRARTILASIASKHRSDASAHDREKLVSA